jgi:pimeloyl-ACP methyl ester carboxylesterase
MNTTTDTSIRPFRAGISQAAIDDLRGRLRAARYQPPLPGDGWDTGIPGAYLREFIEDWREFDWAAYQARLNQVPQYTTVIDGQAIHFAHITSAEPGAVPVLLTHGWPGSFLEFLNLIGPMTDPAVHGGDPGDAMHLVIPSLPGFGFSTPLASAGWTTTRVAAAWAELMTRLGYERFAVHGGDIGAVVSPEVGRVAPQRVIGVHVNGALGFAADIDEEALAAMAPLDRDRAARVQAFMREEYGYIAIQSTRPGLVGIALVDSPVAQLAWMLDKLHAWTYPPSALPDAVLGRDWILANASLYWFTASGGSAAYVTYAQGGGWGTPPVNSGVPTAAIQFAHDVGIRSQSTAANTIVRWTDVTDRGGHFAALEEPQLLIDDIRQFLRGIRDRAARHNRA